MDLAHLVQTISIYALPVIFGITLHEAAHGYVAKHFGDTTAYVLGRVSLNPVRHIDLVGTIIVPLVILLATSWGAGQGMLFGWAKPVPVNYHALRKPKRDMMWVAAAGPAANLAMALGWALTAKLALVMPSNYFTDPLFLISQAGVTVNLVLMLLNLIPLLAARRRAHRRRPAADADGRPVRAPRALGLPDPARADVHERAWDRPRADGGRLAAADRERVRDALTWSLNGWCRGCARPARCTWATTTARSRTGCGCRASIRATSSSPTGTRSRRITRSRRSSSRTCGTWWSTGSPPASTPAQATLFIQSRVPEHAELHTLLSMITPLGWLERVPTYKDQQEKLTDRDLSTYGFLGYPLLQAADVLIYRAKFVPVGEDQVPHVEFMREIARRFNHIYGREPGFEEKALAAAKKLGSAQGEALPRAANEVPGAG